MGFLKDCVLIKGVCCYCYAKGAKSINPGHEFQLYDGNFHPYFTLDFTKGIRPYGFGSTHGVGRLPYSPWIPKGIW